MSRFEPLIACIRAAQLTDAQPAAELRYSAFAAYYRQQNP